MRSTKCRFSITARIDPSAMPPFSIREGGGGHVEAGLIIFLIKTGNAHDQVRGTVSAICKNPIILPKAPALTTRNKIRHTICCANRRVE